jgi:hypothetical protein
LADPFDRSLDGPSGECQKNEIVCDLSVAAFTAEIKTIVRAAHASVGSRPPAIGTIDILLLPPGTPGCGFF